MANTENSELKSEPQVRCMEWLAHLSEILKTMRQEEAERNGHIYPCRPSPEEEKYLAQFNATKTSVLLAIERCANAPDQQPGAKI